MAVVTSVPEFIEKHNRWKTELLMLRDIISNTELIETIKWGAPVYTINGKNVLGFGAFKSYFGIWFFQGVFLNDTLNVLISASEGKTKGLRQWRFTTLEEMDENQILNYVKEAIENQKLGKEIKPKFSKTYETPNELKQAFNADSKLHKAFKNLSFGKQKEFANYIVEAKQLDTKLKRIAKIEPMILNGIGLHDKYKNC